jgi:hypothetical protein
MLIEHTANIVPTKVTSHYLYADDAGDMYKDPSAQLSAHDCVLDLDKLSSGFPNAVVEFSKQSSDFDGYVVTPEAAIVIDDVFSRPPYTKKRSTVVANFDSVGVQDEDLPLPTSVGKVHLFPTRELVMSKVMRIEDGSNAKDEPPAAPQSNPAPAPVLQQVSPVVEDQVPPSRGLEGDLVSLLETVIQTQHESMQSQQALVIEALRHREHATVHIYLVLVSFFNFSQLFILCALRQVVLQPQAHMAVQPPAAPAPVPVTHTSSVEVQTSPDRPNRTMLGRLLSRGARVFLGECTPALLR